MGRRKREKAPKKQAEYRKVLWALKRSGDFVGLEHMNNFERELINKTIEITKELISKEQ